MSSFIVILFTFRSCFCHVLELVAKAFVTSLSPPLKSRINTIASLPDDPSDKADHAPNGSLDDSEDKIALELKEVASDFTVEADAKSLLLRVRGLSAKVRRSPGAKAFFLECCNMTESPPLQLLGYCET